MDNFLNPIYSDLNVRIEDISPNGVTVKDTKAVVQSLWRLLNTQEGEIPNFRAYGLNVKQWLQKPLSEAMANDIFEHVQKKIQQFEPRGEIINVVADAKRDSGEITMRFTMRVIATGDTFQLPLWSVQTGVSI